MANFDASKVNNAIGEEEATAALCCPMCQKATRSLKRFEFPRVVFVFLLVFYSCSYRTEIVTACPRCLRRYLTFWGLVSLVPANLLWPLAVFPLLWCRFFASFLPGHRLKSKSLAKKIGGGVAVVGMVPAAFLTTMATLAMFLGSSDAAREMQAVLPYSVSALLAFTVLGALADV